MKPFILGAIFARGGSKGIPKKNIRLLAGKPLIAYAIETAKACSLIDAVIVSTNDEEIANVSRQWGADVPFMRPAQLATDDSPMLVAQQHAVKTFEEKTGKRVDILVSIPTTSPLRDVKDVDECIQKLLDSDADVVMSVTRAHRNPYFNMVTLDQDENAHLVIEPSKNITRRQDAPVVYDVTTVAYAIRTSYLEKNKPLIHGKVKIVEIPRERALDIDTLFDFEIAECLINKKGC